MESHINENLQPSCYYCSTQLFEPYIECVECENASLCTNCFSKGVEIMQHKNNHKYAVRKNNFPLFENCNWSAKDEFNLLKYIGEHGYGNWDEIAKSMQTHSMLECQEHFKKFYIDNTQDQLPNFFSQDPRIHELYELPFLLRQSNSDDPPRQTNSTASQQIAGYNAYRSDFEMNFDNNAESVLSFETVDYGDDKELMESLQCSLVIAYNNRLRERKRRYNIIREHGLILMRKFTSWLRSYEEFLGRQTCEKLAVTMQLVSGIQFDFFIERLSLEKELHMKILRLYELRKYGIKTFKGAYLYQNLKRKEDKFSKELKALSASAELDWKNISTNTVTWKNTTVKSGTLWKNSLNTVKGNTQRKISTPLEIVGLPGYEHLTDKEKELCSTVRLVPVNFIEFRDLLVSENNKNGYLRLLDARKLIKIDVNKTRKLYDYLVAEGFVNKPV